MEERQLLSAYAAGEISVEDALPRPVYEEYLKRRQQDSLGDYDWINSNAVVKRGPRVSMERRHLCNRCGLHFLATTLFASASYGPRITHQLVWDPQNAWIGGQMELGAYSIPKDSKGHGRAGMWLENYEQLEAVTKNLFLQQVRHATPTCLAQRFGDTPLRLAKELQRARQLLGMRRRRGSQTRWWAPGEPCSKCKGAI